MSNDTVLTISCDTCVMRHTDACADCLVSFLCDPARIDPTCADAAPMPVTVGRREAVVLDLDEVRAMRLLASAGLVPTLRHREAI
jgi:hypothetical protein